MLKGYLHISTSANKNLIGIKVSLYLKPNILIKRQSENTISTPAKAVSYTHLTLPTKRIV